MSPRPRTTFRLAMLALAFLACAPPPARAQEFRARPADARTDTSEARVIETPEPEEFPVVLGSFTTTLAGSRPERTANVRLAAQALDGTVLDPGQVLSFDRVVGPRTLERGYLQAPVILHETRQLQTGGGVCQTASTLFVAGLLSGLSSVERWRHSSPVDYIALGHDATIAWGAKDLKLRNDTGQRVRVRVFVRGATLSARFEGERPLEEALELVTEERELPVEAGVDGAQPGREVELYRVRRGAGGGVSRELVLRDVYPPTRGEKPEP